MDRAEQFPLIAKTMAELEDVLAEELISLGADGVQIGRRMVSFTGDKALMYKTNLHCRTALRILKPIHTFEAKDADAVYEAVKQIDWDAYLSLNDTFAVDAVVYSDVFTHSKFVAYRTKDAIADRFTEKYGKRPSVSVSNPDLLFHIHVAHTTCTLSLDSSGESLHRRGYRVAQTEAPLNEVLAAGMILKSGWRGESAFIDPMCGSGTLLVEAAMIALGIPPGIHRNHFAFEKWKDFDQDLFSEIYNDESGARELTHRIVGSDISPKAIAIAEKNIKNAGLKKYIELSVKPFQQYTELPEPHGIVMTNPPYGERIKVEKLDELYGIIGERLKHLFAGYNAYILSYRKECFDAIGLKPSRRFFLYNGALECEMRQYEIFEGKRKAYMQTEAARDHSSRERDETLYERNSREGYRRSQRAARAEKQQTTEGAEQTAQTAQRERDKPVVYRTTRTERDPETDYRSYKRADRNREGDSKTGRPPFKRFRRGREGDSKTGSRPYKHADCGREGDVGQLARNNVRTFRHTGRTGGEKGVHPSQEGFRSGRDNRNRRDSRGTNSGGGKSKRTLHGQRGDEKRCTQSRSDE